MTSFRFATVGLAMALAACGGSDDAPRSGSPAAVWPGALGEAPSSALPDTEEALVEAVGLAIERQDITQLEAASAPELAADLRRMHDRDPQSFWRRGQRWVVNVKTGFKVAHRSDSQQSRWKALLEYGNGLSETVVFTRIDGRILYEQL